MAAKKSLQYFIFDKVIMIFVTDHILIFQVK